MTECGHKILVVAHTPRLAGALVSWLGDSRNDLVFANSYAGGKAQLTAHPDVLITEIKLGEYNGLQLALRGQAAGIPAVVVGPNDFEHEAEQLGVTFLRSDNLQSDDVALAIDRVVEHADGRQASWSTWEAAASASVLH